MEPVNNENKNPSTIEKRQFTEGSDLNNEDQTLSLINRKFLCGRALDPAPYHDNSLDFRPQYFFFYGSLMDALQLRRVLRLKETPVLQSASIVGWDTMLWGQYPALIFKVNNITRGMAYEVQKEEHVESLTCYETEFYGVKGCTIKLADGREVAGKTFVWNAEKELLREGSFDLRDWKMEQLEKPPLKMDRVGSLSHN